MQPAAQPAYFQPVAQTPASAPEPQDPALPRAGALETGVETTFVPFMRQADSCNEAVREMRPFAADRYSPDTSCSWPPRLRRFRGNARFCVRGRLRALVRTSVGDSRATRRHPPLGPAISLECGRQPRGTARCGRSTRLPNRGACRDRPRVPVRRRPASWRRRPGTARPARRVPRSHDR